MKHTQAKSHDFKRLLGDIPSSDGNHLVERKHGTVWSCTTYITATSQRLSFEPKYMYALQVGLTSPLELVSVP